MKNIIEAIIRGFHCGCTILFVVGILLIGMICYHINYYKEVIIEAKPGGIFPLKATDINIYRTFFNTYYEYTVEKDVFLREAGTFSGGCPTSIPPEGVEILCFRFEEYKNGGKIPSGDPFYSRTVFHGYYIKVEHSLLVYDSETKRAFFSAWR